MRLHSHLFDISLNEDKTINLSVRSAHRTRRSHKLQHTFSLARVHKRTDFPASRNVNIISQHRERELRECESVVSSKSADPKRARTHVRRTFRSIVPNI